MGPEVPLEHCSRSRLWSALSFGHRYSQFIWLIKICCMLMDLSQSVRWRGGKRVGNSHSWCHFPLWADSPLPPSTTSCTYLSKLTSRKCCTFLAMDHGAGIPTMCRLDKGHLSPVIKASQHPSNKSQPKRENYYAPRLSFCFSCSCTCSFVVP